MAEAPDSGPPEEVIQYQAPLTMEDGSLAAPPSPCPPVAPPTSSSHFHPSAGPTHAALDLPQLQHRLAEVRQLVRQMVDAIGLGDPPEPPAAEVAQQQLSVAADIVHRLNALLQETPPSGSMSHEGAGRVRDARPPAPIPQPTLANVRPAIMPTREQPQTLAFRHTHDQGGLMHLIGTLGGKEEWKNPVIRGLVQVTASSIKSGRPAEVGDRRFEMQRFFTANEDYSWIAIDFGAYRIRPTHYSFAHRGGREVGYYARNWELHGSKDGVTWQGVLRHINDQALNHTCYAASWPIGKQSDFLRAFRVALDPKGNSLGTSALVVSCFEVYGDWYYDEGA